MKHSLIFLLVLIFSFNVSAETSVATVDSDSHSHSKFKNYAGFGLGIYVGEAADSYKYGRFISKNNLAELTIARIQNDTAEERDGKYIAAGRGMIYSISNKFFLWRSFYVSAGVAYKTFEIEIPKGKVYRYNGETITDLEFKTLAAPIAIGNHWFGENWSFGIDWIGISPVIANIKEVPGMTEGRATIGHFTIGYSF